MRTTDFSYALPPEHIAQKPLEFREMARMLVVNRATGELSHCFVTDLISYVQPGDLLVLNNAKVNAARIYGVKEDTGGKVELLILERSAPGEWEALLRASRRPAAGSVLRLGTPPSLRATFLEDAVYGRCRIGVEDDTALEALMETEGQLPLPHYIHRTHADAAVTAMDRERYQTVFAEVPGAVAAPTAGLHFTRPLMEDLCRHGAGFARLTLQVGPGTFRPVKTEQVEDHPMEFEAFAVSPEAADAINRTRAGGGRIIAVGSTSTRTLETLADRYGEARAGTGRTNLFIYPPYAFRLVDVLLTNFHLPESTLLMMVCAFAGRELTLRAYREAVKAGYRFYSYGDCMLVI